MMNNVEILMMDGCTKSEAEKHLKNGTIVFDGEDFENNFYNYMNEWEIGVEDIPSYEIMIKERNPIEDWGIVEHDGKTFYIMYVL